MERDFQEMSAKSSPGQNLNCHKFKSLEFAPIFFLKNNHEIIKFASPVRNYHSTRDFLISKALFCPQIHLHSTSDNTLYEYIPKESIPNPDFDNLEESSTKLLKESITLLDKYQKWFDDDEKLARVDNSKRAHKSEKRSSFLKSLWGRQSE